MRTDRKVVVPGLLTTYYRAATSATAVKKLSASFNLETTTDIPGLVW
jgi:hypothetical protein